MTNDNINLTENVDHVLNLTPRAKKNELNAGRAFYLKKINFQISVRFNKNIDISFKIKLIKPFDSFKRRMYVNGFLLVIAS